MSYNSVSIWVSDLDAYISVGGSYDDAEADAHDRLMDELEIAEDTVLLTGECRSACDLYHDDGITPANWHDAVHQARMAITSELGHGPGADSTPSPEQRFINAMLNLGRRYAVTRYARSEGLDASSAVTATLSHGIRALLRQYLLAEGLPFTFETSDRIRAALASAPVSGPKGGRFSSEVGSAYRRTGAMQVALHALADETPGHRGGRTLDRDRTREILSLTRLYFSCAELRLSSLQELRSLLQTYEADRKSLGHRPKMLRSNGRNIKFWRLRHIRSLLDFYPYAIRQGLLRGAAAATPTTEALVNELAIAHLRVENMRNNALNRATGG